MLRDKVRGGEVHVETTMCDSFQGLGNFSRNALGIDSDVYRQHATGNVLYTLHCLHLQLTQWPAGISAAKRNTQTSFKRH